MREFELIAQLTPSLPANAQVVTGAGDDCAVLDLGAPEHLILFKTDAVVEGIHFTKDTPAQKIGHKALARCLSDIAAMAGTPTAALVTLALPGGFEPGRVTDIYAGLNDLAGRYQVAVAGGETTSNPDRLLISIAMIGTIPRGKPILRSGARPGDAIFVTGELGGSLAGKHLDFEPRLAEARWLAAHFHLHSLMDISDGLAGDLRHILTASGVGAELLKSAVPVARAARLRAREKPDSRSALTAALSDGEDFELLFTLASGEAVRLVDAWKLQFPQLKLSCVGKIVPGHGILIRDKMGARPLNENGYVHFS